MVRATDEAYESLRAAILGGEVAPGERLGEVELAEQLGVSRTPVREALRRLAADGLVEVLPNRGARVAQWTTEDLEEIYDLRAMLESHGAARAAERIDPAELPALHRLCAEMEACAERGRKRDLDRLAELNAELHRRIVDAAASPRLASLIAAVVQVPLVMRTFQRYDADALQRSLGHHRELVAALAAQDGEWARSVMRSHVLAAKAVLVAAAPPQTSPMEGESA
ncbi:MAG TPA: GntR family transcriptional regulator [Marmoricola sp.]|nr:GntR family transcriptional regulator [Marmoricola sp.]